MKEQQKHAQRRRSRSTEIESLPKEWEYLSAGYQITAKKRGDYLINIYFLLDVNEISAYDTYVIITLFLEKL